MLRAEGFEKRGDLSFSRSSLAAEAICLRLVWVCKINYVLFCMFEIQNNARSLPLDNAHH